MPITLTRAGTTVDLTERQVWTNEFSWHPVGQVHDVLTQGDLWVHTRERTAGREIDLDGYAKNAWLPRSDVLQLDAWARMAGAQFELVLRGVTHTVMFDHTRKPAFEATDIWGGLLNGEYAAAPTLEYRTRLKLIEI